MTAREWKPGDVAAWDIDGHVEVIFFRNGGQDFDQPGWQTAQDGEGYPTDDQLRPLVVLDLPKGALAGWPTLISALRTAKEKTGLDLIFGGLIDQIEAQTRPPKPAEPTGLGAVVEDAEGADWHRTREGRWIAADGLRTQAGGWGHIDAVRVLFEGVTA